MNGPKVNNDYKTYTLCVTFVDGRPAHIATLSISKAEWRANRTKKQRADLIEAKLKQLAFNLGRDAIGTAK